MKAFYILVMTCCLCLVGCQRPQAPLTDIDPRGARLPKVALAPMQVQLPQTCYFPQKEIVQEASDYLFARNFAQGSRVIVSNASFLQKQKRVPIQTLWHGADLRAANLLLPHDFIVLAEIKRFELRRTEDDPVYKHSLRGFKHIKPFYYQVQVYIRIINMTGLEPCLAMQEHLDWRIPVSTGQVQSDQIIDDWHESSFDRTGIACVLVKICQEISDRSKLRIDAAWSKRLPLSRLPKRAF